MRGKKGPDVQPYLDKKSCKHIYSTFLRILDDKENVLGRVWYCPRCKYEYTQDFYTHATMPPEEGVY